MTSLKYIRVYNCYDIEYRRLIRVKKKIKKTFCSKKRFRKIKHCNTNNRHSLLRSKYVYGNIKYSCIILYYKTF